MNTFGNLNSTQKRLPNTSQYNSVNDNEYLFEPINALVLFKKVNLFGRWNCISGKPLQLLCREWKLPGLGSRPSLLSQRGGLYQWAGCASQREEGGSVEKGQFCWPGPEDKARTLPMGLQRFLEEMKNTYFFFFVTFILQTSNLHIPCTTLSTPKSFNDTLYKSFIEYDHLQCYIFISVLMTTICRCM